MLKGLYELFWKRNIYKHIHIVALVEDGYISPIHFPGNQKNSQSTDLWIEHN